MLAISLFFPLTNLQAQCTNADFSNGDFSGGWSGTYCAGNCSGTIIFGICTGCETTDPLHASGFNAGPNNDPPSDASTEYSHVLCTTAGGNDPNITSLGGSLPMVYPGGASTYSCRQGNMWQTVGGGQGDGETTTYTFVVTPANCNFTYHYAVVLNDGGHSAGEQPFFQISMKDGTGAAITCANYLVDATTAQTIGGFNAISSASVYWKPWSSVFIPLNNYIGQTVSITFTSRGCLPSGCAGSHYSYAYISAECAPLTLVASSPTVCGGTNLTLTAPNGAATYSWTGPGIVSGANQQVVTIDQPGQYTVNMTTFGDQPCTFSLDTVMTGNPANPQAIFSAPVVCAGNATQFTDASSPHASISQWAWDFGDGNTSTATNPSHTYATPGTYNVKLTVTSTPCTKDTIVPVTVSPPPTTGFTGVSPICAGQPSTLTYYGNGLAGDTYNWNFDGGTATPATGMGPISVTWATPGTKNVHLIVSAGTCQSPDTVVQIVVNTSPVMTITPHTDICTGGNTSLTATGATTYAWAADPSLSATNTASVIVSPASSTSYTVTGTSNGCFTVDTTSVSVYPVPTSTFTATTPLCTGQSSSVVYTGTASAAATYAWGWAGGTPTPASGQGPFQVLFNNAGSWTLSLTVSEHGCSSTPTNVPIVVNPTPTSTFTATTPLCTGQVGNITYTGAATGTAVYTWGFGSGTTTGGPGAGPYTITFATAGVQNITLSVTDNGCNSPLTTVPVTVYPIPTANFTAISPVCALSNSAVNYTGTATAAATYTWNFNGGTATPGTGQGPQAVNWATAGTYNIILNVTEHGCVAPPDTVPVTVYQVPTSTFTATGPVCTGDISTVTYTGNADNLATYTWNYDGGAANPGTGMGPQSVTWATAGTKNVTLVVSENGCSSPLTTQPVIVNAIPTCTFTVTSPLCAGQNGTITYTGSSTNQAIYTWGISGGNLTSGSLTGAGPLSVNWSSAGTPVVSLAITDHNCVGTPTQLPVTVNPIPTSFAHDTFYCSGITTATIGTPATAGYTYLWNPATGLSSATASDPSVSLTTSPALVVTQLYTVTTTSLGCSSTAQATVTVNPVPAPAFTPPAAECLTGNSFTFKSAGANLSSATFNWSFGPTAVPATSTSSSQSVTYGTAGTFAVALTITQTGCTNSVTDSETVYPMPTTAFTPDTVVGCENFNVCFADSSKGVGGLTYVWNFGDGEGSSDASPCHIFVAPGLYSVYLKVTSSQQCSYDMTVPNLIKVIANPIAKFTPSATVIQQPESAIDFTNESLNSVTYLWTFANEGVLNNIIGNSSDVNPHYNFTNYGLYSVKLVSYNQLGCADSTQLPITVLPPQSFFVPNAFTPNGDGNNDIFYPEYQEGVTLMSFQVFDRWGEKVHDGLYPWDGMYKGKPAPANVYVYQCKIKLVTDNIAMERKGSVTLIR